MGATSFIITLADGFSITLTPYFCLSSSSSSAPCKPDSVSVNLQCSSNTALVTWGNSGPDQTQVVTAVDRRGLITTCNSSSSNCTFDQMSCGKTYVISVVGHTNTCSSEPAVGQQLITGTLFFKEGSCTACCLVLFSISITQLFTKDVFTDFIMSFGT